LPPQRQDAPHLQAWPQHGQAAGLDAAFWQPQVHWAPPHTAQLQTFD